MVGLLDIAPLAERVDVDGQPVEVTGVSVEGIAHLLQHFPQFTQLKGLMGGSDTKDLPEILFAMGPHVVAAIIAAGCGYPNNDDAIKKTMGLNLQAQADLLETVLRRTLPKGLDPFLARIESIKATLSSPPNLADKVKEAVKKKSSPKPSSPLLDGQGIQPPPSGA